jgi:hypothetical protein
MRPKKMISGVLSSIDLMRNHFSMRSLSVGIILLLAAAAGFILTGLVIDAIVIGGATLEWKLVKEIGSSQ